MKRLLTIVLLVSLTGCAVFSYVSYRINLDYPDVAGGRYFVPGLVAPATIYLDRLGVPHVRAESEADLMRAVGFAQGRDRFFQMDILRRFASGRLSELVGRQPILGSTTLEFDLAMRGWGFTRAAQLDAEQLNSWERNMLEAYAAGVNAAIYKFTPIEYRLLGLEPEPWRDVDTLALARLIAWSVTHNWEQELSRLLLAVHVGARRADAIYPGRRWSNTTSIKPVGERHTLPPSIAPELEAVFPAQPYQAPTNQSAGVEALLTRFSLASNSWVVGGGRSASGMPMQANDPHLTHFLPSQFYQEHISCPGLDVIGATVAGIPYVLMGHNRAVSWGVSSGVADVIDLFVEKTVGDGAVEVDSATEPITVEPVVIRYREGGKLREQIFSQRYTRRGPVINDMYPGLLPPDAPLISLVTMPGGSRRIIEHFAKGNRTHTVEELHQEMVKIDYLLQVMTAADVNGDIAIITTGRLPVRHHHLGTFPAPAWLSRYHWQGWVPAWRMPYDLGGRSDLFVHSNNLVVDPAESDVFYHIDSASSFRKDRIEQLLRATKRHTFQSFAAIQGDLMMLRGKQLTPYILSDLDGTSGLSSQEEQARALLASWDFVADSDSAATAVFWATYREAMLAALTDELSPRGLQFLLSQRYTTNVVDWWITNADHVVWDNRATAAIEKRPAVMRAAFKQAVAWIAERLGDDPSRWRWGDLHRMHFKHLFGARLSAFNLEDAGALGSDDSVWKSLFDFGNRDEPFYMVAGPAFRYILDLADSDHGNWILDTGVSGWPLSPHYCDQYELWKSGEYVPMVMDWDELARDNAGVLHLVTFPQ
jgi:penicillin amidase